MHIRIMQYTPNDALMKLHDASNWHEKVAPDKWRYINLQATKRRLYPPPYSLFDITLFASGIKFWRFR